MEITKKSVTEQNYKIETITEPLTLTSCNLKTHIYTDVLSTHGKIISYVRYVHIYRESTLFFLLYLLHILNLLRPWRRAILVTGFGFNSHWRKWNIEYFHYLALLKRGIELRRLNTKFPRYPLPTLLCTGYSVKLIKWYPYVHYFMLNKNNFNLFKLTSISH